MFRFKIMCTVVDKYDNHERTRPRYFTGKTEKIALAQFKRYIHDKYGFKVLIRDIAIEADNVE